jgi:membrane fusion protein (multidrug efflux system)
MNAAPPASDSPDAPAGASRPDEKRRSFFNKPGAVWPVALVAIGAIFYGATVMWHLFTHESTDDAFVDGRIIAIAPKVSGKISAVRITDNQEVKKGDPLFEIDPRDYEAAGAQKKAALDVARAREKSAAASLEQARAHVLTIQSGLESAKASMEAASAAAKRQHGDLKRNQKLAAGGAISSQEFEHASLDAVSASANLESKASQMAAFAAFLQEAQTQVVSAESQAAAAKAEVERARADLALSDLQISYTLVTAPEDGRVTNKALEPGAFVQVGQALFALVPREFWVTANFKETQITRIRPGQPVRVKVDAYPGHSFRAKVESIQAGSGARFSLLPPENATGNFVKVVQRIPVKIVFDEKPDSRFLLGPGMSAEPDIKTNESAAVLAVIVGLVGNESHATGGCALAPGSQPLADFAFGNDCDFHGGARHVRGKRFPAAHGGEPFRHAHGGDLGSDKLSGRQRHHSAGDELARRPVWSQTVSYRLHPDVYAGIGLVRRGEQPRFSDSGPDFSRRGRGRAATDLAGGIAGKFSPGQEGCGHGGVCNGGDCGADHRADPGRLDHGKLFLALDFLHQSAIRPGRHVAGPVVCRRSSLSQARPPPQH